MRVRRDKSCDIVITRREVSRQHAQLAVDGAGVVWLSSLGREPVSVNGKPATEPTELFAGDQIEVAALGPLGGMHACKKAACVRLRPSQLMHVDFCACNACAWKGFPAGVHTL